jgi:hypothetical protein
MDREKILKAIKRKQLEETLRGDFTATINERISRYQELDFIQLTPNTHFAFVSSECISLYRDGYYFACISLCQAVAEAIVRLMCQKNNLNPSKHFEQNIRDLKTRIIQPDCNTFFKEIWKGRNDYHHINPSIPTEEDELRGIAKNKIITLHNIEAKVFEFKFGNGAIIPKYPKYWDLSEKGTSNVFLRIDP